MKFIRNVVFSVQNRIDKTLSSFSSFVRETILLSTTVVALFWLSIFFYGTFFYYYVPIVSQEKAVYFRFRVCDNGIGMCSFPTANISLTREGQSEVFKRGQIYKLILDMDLPESESNTHLGMFMVEISLYNKTSGTVTSTAKPTTVQYKSSLLQTLETLVFSPLYLFGYMQQKQSIHVELFSEFKDHPYNPSVGAIVTINSLKVEIYTASLKIFAQFSGIRYFLYYWPITAAIIGVTWNFVLLLFITFLSWFAFSGKNVAPDDCKQVVKIDLARKRRPEGPRKAVPEAQATPETIGRPAADDDDDEQTSVLRRPDETTEESLLLRQRLPYKAT